MKKHTLLLNILFVLFSITKSQYNKNYTKEELSMLIKSNYEINFNDESSFNLRRVINPDKYLNSTQMDYLENVLYKKLPLTIYIVVYDIDIIYKTDDISIKKLLNNLILELATQLYIDPIDIVMVIFLINDKKIIQNLTDKMNFNDDEFSLFIKEFSTNNGEIFNQDNLLNMIIKLSDEYHIRSGWKAFKIIFVIMFAIFFVTVLFCMVFCFYKLRSEYNNRNINLNDENVGLL